MAVDTHNGIKLPEPLVDSRMSIEHALSVRRSVRQFKNRPIALLDLSQLLWAAQGVTGSNGKRTAPSAGALYPIELYVVCGQVSGLASGVYAYEPHDHLLRRVSDGDSRPALSSAALGQTAIRDAPAVIVIAAVYQRTTVKYGDRGIRYVHMETGHVAQNIHLQAVSLELGTVVIGAFQDDRVKSALHLPDQVQPLAIMPIGKQ